MRIRAYIDTNILIYAIFHHEKYGSICEKILYDAQAGRIEGHGSSLVAIELLGALSKIDPFIAWNAVKYYLAMNIRIHNVNDLILNMAGLINTVVNVSYDAVHLALMIFSNIDTVITNDLDDWVKISKNFSKIKKRLVNENYEVSIREIKIIPPKQYSETHK